MTALNIRADFLRELHPAPLLLYLGVIVAAALLFSHPMLLAVLTLTLLMVLSAAGSLREWFSAAPFFLTMLIMLVVINNFINPMGATVIWGGFWWPLTGRVNLTLEAVIFSLVMALRLLIVYSAFFFYNKAVDPDRALSLFSRAFPRSTLLAALAVKSIPYLGMQLKRAAEIQQCRGVCYKKGNLVARVKNRIPLLKVIFLTSLEDSFNLGESIHARAYGSGPRTRYRSLNILPADFLILAGAVWAAAALVWTVSGGWGSFEFFPRLPEQPMAMEHMYAGVLLFCGLSLFPLFLWGWGKWNCCK